MKTEEIPPEFQSVNRLFEQLAASGDFARLSEVYTEGARLLPPGGELLTGEIAARDFWTAAAAAMGVKSLILKTIELDILGDTATEIGTAELVAEHIASPSRIKYVVIWKKLDAGWRWDVDIWNASAT